MLWKLLTLSLFATSVYSDSYRAAAYFANWAIYARNFTPQDLPADKLTHVLYAFANVNSTTGEVFLADHWADTDKRFAGDSWTDSDSNLYGCFKLLYLLKQQNRNLKVLLSIGGATYSTNFAVPAASSSSRSTFASSAVSLVQDLGLDGLDIDWEYPENDAQAASYVLLLQAVREALDAYGKTLDPPYHFELTVACPAGPTYYQLMHLADMDGYLDFWNLMAFDYAGNWSPLAANQANLFPSTSDLSSTPFNTKDAVAYYLERGIAASKILLGMPVYGRSFAATEGFGKPFTIDDAGTWQAGVHDFKALPISGAIYDNATGSCYSYDNITNRLISYDDVPTAKQKAMWIRQMRLGGAMWWESSADRTGNDSLIQNVVEILGGRDGLDLDYSQNQLVYPDSTYKNLRAGMLGISSAPLPTSTSEACSSALDTSTPSSLLTPSSFLTSDTSLLSSTSPTSLVTIIVSSVSGFVVPSVASEKASLRSTTDPGCVDVPGTRDLGANTLCPLPASGFLHLTTKKTITTTTTTTITTTKTTTAPITATTLPLSSKISASLHLASSNTASASPAAPSGSTFPISPLPPQPNAEASTINTSCPTSNASCGTYILLACPDGECACGQNVVGQPTCFRNKQCATLALCHTNFDCAADEACAANSCCGSGGYCLPLAVDCLNSPVLKAPPLLLCRKDKSMFAMAGLQTGTSRFRC